MHNNIFTKDVQIFEQIVIRKNEHFYQQGIVALETSKHSYQHRVQSYVTGKIRVCGEARSLSSNDYSILQFNLAHNSNYNHKQVGKLLSPSVSREIYFICLKCSEPATL